MFKILKNIIKGIQEVKRWGSLIFTLLDILGYSADKLEAWRLGNDPAEKVKELKTE